MNNCIREIVTKAIVGKGKKLIRIKNCVTTENAPYSILGCWIINHNFNATLDDDFVCWSHIDNNGDEIEYCYMSIYKGFKGNKIEAVSIDKYCIN